MSYINERVSYLKGLADGLELGNDAAAKLLKAMIEVMDDMAEAIRDNEDNIIQLDECIDEIAEQFDEVDEYLDDVEERLDVIEEELEDCDCDCDCDCDDCDDCDCDCDCDCFDEDDFVEITCPNCNEAVYFDNCMLESGEDLICPSCGKDIISCCEDECCCGDCE